MEERSDDCVVCEQQTNEPLRSCFSGIPKLIEYATVLGNDRLATHLREKRDNNTEVKVHPSCQKNIGNIIRKRKKSNLGSMVTIIRLQRWKLEILWSHSIENITASSVVKSALKIKNILKEDQFSMSPLYTTVTIY